MDEHEKQLGEIHERIWLYEEELRRIEEVKERYEMEKIFFGEAKFFPSNEGKDTILKLKLQISKVLLEVVI